jgi:hypothetical protein
MNHMGALIVFHCAAGQTDSRAVRRNFGWTIDTFVEKRGSADRLDVATKGMSLDGRHERLQGMALFVAWLEINYFDESTRVL